MVMCGIYITDIIYFMFHENSAIEGEFSVNKEYLVENLSEQSLISQRSVYCTVLFLEIMQSVLGTKSLL